MWMLAISILPLSTIFLLILELFRQYAIYLFFVILFPTTNLIVERRLLTLGGDFMFIPCSFSCICTGHFKSWQKYYDISLRNKWHFTYFSSGRIIRHLYQIPHTWTSSIKFHLKHICLYLFHLSIPNILLQKSSAYSITLRSVEHVYYPKHLLLTFTFSEAGLPLSNEIKVEVG